MDEKERIELRIALLDRLIALHNGPKQHFCTKEISAVIEEICGDLDIWPNEVEEVEGRDGVFAEAIRGGKANDAIVNAVNAVRLGVKAASEPGSDVYNAPTATLVEELARREGVEEIVVEPHRPFSYGGHLDADLFETIEGPARALIITD